MTELAILVPVLNRPHRVRPLLDSIRETTPIPTRVVFLTDPDDEAECRAITPLRQRAGNPLWWVDQLDVRGNYAQKINAGLRYTNEPVTNCGGEPALAFLAADDLRFHKGWYEKARAHLKDGIGVVGVNDLIDRRRQHATHFLVTREYAERGTADEPDRLLHEGYNHWWVDDEFIATAKARNAYAYAPHAVVEHLHPMNGGAPDDETYRKGRSQLRQDRKHFLRRQYLWR